MRIERLVLHGFGSFADRTFEFAPGLTLVHGPNEAGKSTLHTALYAALCGVRRGKGRSLAEHEFDRYRPWQGGPWRLSIVLQLEDGSRVEILQDLDDKGRSRVADAVLGADRTAEILPRESTPDASLWLGLDRRAFAATACVRQADLSSVRDEPSRLREHLQRAAATSGADATAAEALARIEVFQKEHVGSRQANSIKPLRRAVAAFETARQVVEAAQAEHRHLESLLGREDSLLEARGRAARELQLAHAALASAEAERLEHDLDRARELQRRHPEGAPPDLVLDDELALEVEGASKVFDLRPAFIVLEGPNAESLRNELRALEAKLAELEEMPAVSRRADAKLGAVGSPVPVIPVRQEVAAAREVDADHGLFPNAALGSVGAAAVPASQARQKTRPAASVSDATQRSSSPSTGLKSAIARARDKRSLLDEHFSHRPTAPEPSPIELSVAELRRLAAVFERSEPRLDRELESRWRELDALATNGVEGRRRAIQLVNVAALIGIAVLVLGLATKQPVLAAGGAAVLLGSGLQWRAARRRQMRRLYALEELRPLEARLAEMRARHDDWVADRDAARLLARSVGVEPEPERLQEIARAVEQRERARARLADWEEVERRLRAEVETADAALRDVLEAEGASQSGDPAADAERYVRGCELRSTMQALELRLSQREREESAAARAAELGHKAEAGLRSAAAHCGVESQDLSVCRSTIERWAQSRRAALASQEAARREWYELDRILAGRTLEALELQAAAQSERARALAAPFEPHELSAQEIASDDLERRAAALKRAETELDRLDVELQLRAAAAPSVAEAEEACREAERELQRVQGLETVLETTRQFLSKAQERAHRDIAPVLAATVRDALPHITDGRYEEVRVDPGTLELRVRERNGEWRDVALLSHGTTEQIDLVLRMALARHLVRRGEKAPLLLDDVTVQFDTERKRAVLEMLHRASAETQIVLCTQEDDVLDWAMGALSHRDAIVRLNSPGE